MVKTQTDVKMKTYNVTYNIKQNVNGGIMPWHDCSLVFNKENVPR